MTRSRNCRLWSAQCASEPNNTPHGVEFQNTKPHIVVVVRTASAELSRCAEHRFCNSERQRVLSNRFKTRLVFEDNILNSINKLAAIPGLRLKYIRVPKVERPEEWRDLPGYEGDYQVSHHGRVWSRRKNHSQGGLLTPTANGRGYPTVRVNGVTKTVHELVADSFMHARAAGEQVCHWDDDKTNNNWSNLYIGTPRTNAKDRFFNNSNKVVYGDIYPEWHLALVDDETGEVVYDLGRAADILAELRVSDEEPPSIRNARRKFLG